MLVSEIVQRVTECAAEPLPQRVDGVEEAQDETTRHVVLTGGEPMLANSVVELCDSLSELGYHITIETAGTIDRHLKCDLMSISPKLSNSTPTKERAGQWAERHEATRYRPDVVASLIERHNYQLKFVVADPADVVEIESYIAEVGSVDHNKVLLMPEGIDDQTLRQRASWLEGLCEENGFTFCPRQHIAWYGNKRAT